MSNEDDPHIKANAEVIREYLRSEFKGFETTEKRDNAVSYTFAVTRSADERYHLKVYWAQLSVITGLRETRRNQDIGMAAHADSLSYPTARVSLRYNPLRLPLVPFYNAPPSVKPLQCAEAARCLGFW